VGSGASAQPIPVILEAGTAAVIAVTIHSPFGEPERVTGRWLAYLRLGTTMALAAAAVGALATGAAIAGGLDGGTLDLLRNVAGMTGIGLLLATVTGGGLAWTGPMAYLVVAEYAIVQSWRTPWVWPARPPHDRGGAICATLVFVAGIATVTPHGVQDPARDWQCSLASGNANPTSLSTCRTTNSHHWLRRRPSSPPCSPASGNCSFESTLATRRPPSVCGARQFP
jgi:hypothetical protein